MVKRHAQAIRALQDVMILGRHMAYEKCDHSQIAELLDEGEYLPYLILADEDQSDTFRRCLVSIATKFRWQSLVDRFDQD